MGRTKQTARKSTSGKAHKKTTCYDIEKLSDICFKFQKTESTELYYIYRSIENETIQFFYADEDTYY